MMTKKDNSFQISSNGTIADLKNCDALAFLESLPDNTVDLIVSSPPYCIGKEYESSVSAQDFLEEHERILSDVVRVIKPGGSICWQIGYHVKNNEIVPLDALIYSSAVNYADLKLRNRLIWTFGHGTHSRRRFSGRHETILWFTKGENYNFDLDAVRILQKYPGKRHYKGPNKGEWSGNPLGKNPEDVWDIPNVKSRHVEKTAHPCQFPIALAQRLVKALCPKQGLVVDPYFGAGTTAVAALLEGRNFKGSEIDSKYTKLAIDRLQELKAGTVRMRPDVPIRVPSKTEAVANLPPHFRETDL